MAIDRDSLGGACDQDYGNVGLLGRALRHGNEPRSRLQPHDLLHTRAVVRQVQTRPYANLEHTPMRMGQRSSAIGQELAIAHREIDDVRQDVIIVEAHTGCDISLQALRRMTIENDTLLRTSSAG